MRELRGKPVASRVMQEAAFLSGKVFEVTGRKPSLHVVLAGDNPASKIYVRRKEKSAAELGIQCVVHKVPDHYTQDDVIDLIARLNHDRQVDAIMVQLPLPKHMDEEAVISVISPAKDADRITAQCIGDLVRHSAAAPCTPRGIVDLLDYYGIELSGKHAVIIGRSVIVGKTLAELLIHRDCTVTLCHSKSRGVKDFARSADILISAVGKPGFITADMVNQDTVLIDVGINRLEDGTIVGDACTEAQQYCGAYTPVPGGIGLTTVAELMLSCAEITYRKFCDEEAGD